MKEEVLKVIDRRIERLKAEVPKHIKIMPEEVRDEIEKKMRFAFDFAKIELEALREEVLKIKDVGEILDECRALRGLPQELRHRTFFEFGGFIRDMVDYLVFGELSKDADIREFQKKVDRSEWDPEKFETYVKLFHEFWKNFGRW